MAKNQPAYFALRVRKKETLKLINELAEKFGNRNNVLNEALNIGVPLLYAQTFGDKNKSNEPTPTPAPPSVARELKQIRKNLDDLFVETSIQETLLAGLFNARVAELGGEPVNPEALLDGSMCDLPAIVAAVKDELERRTTTQGGDNHDE